jgi:hypothetical protein
MNGIRRMLAIAVVGAFVLTNPGWVRAENEIKTIDTHPTIERDAPIDQSDLLLSQR